MVSGTAFAVTAILPSSSSIFSYRIVFHSRHMIRGPPRDIKFIGTRVTSIYSAHLKVPSHFFVVVKVDLLNWEIPNLDSIWADKHSEILLASEIPLALDTEKGAFEDHERHQNPQTYDPSFFPIGSSYSIPIQTPSLFPNLVGPTNLTVPRLWKPSSLVSTSQREPTTMLTSATVCSCSCFSSPSAKRPILCRCLYAGTIMGLGI